LQRHGWTLEGVFPGGYAPDSVVQQWGLNLNTGAVNMRIMRIKRPYFDAIMEGRKTLEVRVGYDSIKRYRVGDKIRLETSQISGVVQIKQIRTYTSFGEMIRSETWRKIMPDVHDQDLALRKIREIYPPHKEALGIYVFELMPIS
jgi:ASC-1-like (ASCH) protein